MIDSNVGVERPKRWSVPFALEVAAGESPYPMGDETVDELLSIPPFNAMDPARFPAQLPLRGILANDTRWRIFQRGDVIVRQGDYGNSAFMILRGSVRAMLDEIDAASLGRQTTRRRSAWRSLRRMFSASDSPESRYPTYAVSPDAVTVPMPALGRENRRYAPPRVSERAIADKRSVLMRSRSDVAEWELFGELAALGRVPRSVTVVADSDCELLEIRWQGLRELRKYDDGLRAWVDRRYRERGLDRTLRSSPLLAHLGEQEIAALVEAAQFETYGSFDWHGSYRKLQERGAGYAQSEEPVIAEEGHYPNGLILLRAGFARLCRRHGDGERTLRYLGRGDLYGLSELVRNAQRGTQDPLSCSLRAVGYVDVVRIPTATVEKLVFPNVSVEEVVQLASEHGGADTATQNAGIDPDLVEFFGERRVFNGTETMLINLDRCVRCDDCVRACAAGHDGNPRFVRQGPKFGNVMVANACMHCMDPVCMIGCPTGAIHRDLEHGEVVINDQTCIGCGTCANSCPYGNIRVVPVRDRTRDDALMMDSERGAAIMKATKCDLCIDHHGGPACVRACPHDALVRIDTRDTPRLAAWLNR
jgi:Fe-S-cluster-containing dehydrogenase component/CRP-like cAMP-binding protein